MPFERPLGKMMIKVKGAITRGGAHGFLCCGVIDVTIVLIHSEISVKLDQLFGD